MLELKKKFHLSLDDVGDVLYDEFRNQNQSLSSFLSHTHAKYNCVWGLNFFTKWKNSNIYSCDMSQLFDVNSASIGCHAPEFAKKPYELTSAENKSWVDAFYEQASSYNVKFSRLVRFHYYSELYECAEVLRKHGVSGIFLTDRPAVSYRLPEDFKQELKDRRYKHYQGLDLFRTDFRLEWLKEKRLDRKQLVELFHEYTQYDTPLVIYGHEYEYRDPEMYAMTESVLSVLIDELGFTCMMP